MIHMMWADGDVADGDQQWLEASAGARPTDRECGTALNGVPVRA
jgi:hypothetical protein